MSSSAPTLSTQALEAALREILGDALAPGDASYAVDGGTPQFVATPETPEQLARALHACDAIGAAVVPWGAGLHMSLGNVPTRYDIALRTTKLNRMLEYEPADLTITVEAGTTFEGLQTTLRDQGQFLPIDAPVEATVGGVLAAGVNGPTRHAYGLPRDWLIGCRIAHVDGAVVKGGGRVVKNVAGYDLPKLAVGSLGTLGVIVEATFKVAPLPAAQETLLFAHDTLDAAARAVFAADERGLALRSVAIVDDGAGATAAFWVAGPTAAVERTRRELGSNASGGAQHLQGEASERWWGDLASSAADSCRLRTVLLPSKVAPFLAHVRQLAGEVSARATSVTYPTSGLVLTDVDGPVEVLAPFVHESRRAAEDAGGSLVIESALPEVKRSIDVWGETSALELMRQLKQQFDARSTLNPGRFVGGI